MTTRREFYNSPKKQQKKSFWDVFFKDSFCQVIWKIRRIYKAIYRIISRKTSICRILDLFLYLDEHTLVKYAGKKRKNLNPGENEKLGNLVWDIYIELSLSLAVYSEWKDLLYRAGYLDSFEEANFIDAYNYKKTDPSKHSLCLRYSIMCIFCIQKEKKIIMQKCNTQVEYHQNQEIFHEIWDAIIVPVRVPQNSKRNWVMIGFQGDDPSTDFRSMGE
ncbi:unnamed protein product [Pneumocystis jirovecii]|uniref:ELMO domain-containing protein n=1 Tax=Pneumocystis jirovecii TaxID=42068 RepID=L0PDE0_PNEJI|nr:unnamed protein product [Pneumocystis jirovecii]